VQKSDIDQLQVVPVLSYNCSAEERHAPEASSHACYPGRCIQVVRSPTQPDAMDPLGCGSHAVLRGSRATSCVCGPGAARRHTRTRAAHRF
jgi:hypothetical protein